MREGWPPGRARNDRISLNMPGGTVDRLHNTREPSWRLCTHLFYIVIVIVIVVCTHTHTHTPPTKWEGAVAVVAVVTVA